MSVSKRTAFWTLISTGILLSFNNCSQDVGFTQVPEASSTATNTTGAPLPTPVAPPIAPAPPVMPPVMPPVTVEEIKTTCMNTMPTTKSVAVKFPKPNMTCEWNKNGNLAPRNQYLQARIEQTALLDIPAGAVICGMDFAFANQQFLYDDHFLFTFNGFVLASSYNFSSQLTPGTDGLQAYDWGRIAGSFWDNSKEGTFCAGKDAGKSVCSWPQTDVPGSIFMSFAPETFYSIMAKDTARAQHAFQFVSIGDNDDLDCEHSEINFTVNVSYIMPM